MAGNSTIGALRVVLGLDSAELQEGLNRAQKHLKKFSKDVAKIGQQVTGVGQALTLGLTAPIAAFGVASVRAAQQSADAFAQVEAALKSMGGASGRTAEQLQANAKALQDMAAIDDDEILRNVTANLLTFGKVSGPVFDRAQTAIVDLATRMKMELQPATLLVGKALNDPLKGLTAMGRAGIQFTDAQKAMITQMVKVGNVAGAQSIILGELERQFGGSAKAAADANPYARLSIALGELSETIGAKLIPVVQPMVESLTRLLQGFDKLSPAAQKFAVVGGIIAAAVGPLLIITGSLISAISTIAAVMAGPALAAFGAFLAPLLPIIAAVGALVAVFLIFREQITPVLQEWGKTVAEVLGPKIAPLIEAVKSAFSSLAALVAPLFKPGGALGGAVSAFLSILTRAVGALTSMLGGALDFITGIFNAIGALLRGDWSTMWGYLGKAVLGLVKGVLGAFAAFAPEVIGWVKKTWEGVKLWLVDKFTTIVKAVGEKVQAVAGFFKSLWDAVVGHSYVPDMVDGIRDEFARLDEVMVKPALAATAKVNAAFKSVADQMRAANDNSRGGMPTARNGRGPESGGDPVAHNTGTVETKTWGGAVFAPQELEDLRQQFVGFGKGLVGAIKDGKLGDFFKGLGEQFASRLMDRAFNALFDALGKAGGTSGGGLGSVLSSAFGSMKLPAFANGGSIKVGGAGGIDSQTVALRASPNERISVTKGDPGGRGGTNVFDMRGALVTQDLLDQVNRMVANGNVEVLGAVAQQQRRRDTAAQYRARR